MNLAPPIPRLGRPFADAAKERSASARVASGEPDAREGPHPGPPARATPPDYMILVVVVALAAVGILMVYSSSAMKGYLSPTPTRSRRSDPRSSGRCSGSSRWSR